MISKYLNSSPEIIPLPGSHQSTQPPAGALGPGQLGNAEVEKLKRTRRDAKREFKDRQQALKLQQQLDDQ